MDTRTTTTNNAITINDTIAYMYIFRCIVVHWQPRQVHSRPLGSGQKHLHLEARHIFLYDSHEDPMIILIFHIRGISYFRILQTRYHSSGAETC